MNWLSFIIGTVVALQIGVLVVGFWQDQWGD